MKRKLSALLLSGALLVGSAGAAFTPAKTYTPGQFTDVAANVWYAASVQKVYELNLMNGSSAATFNPNGMFTVAEALTVAARMHSLSHGGSGSLPAASGAWYQGAVDYCLQNKLITGGQFDSYTRAATRAEMAGVIRAALPDDQWKAINSVSALPDVNMGNEYAQAIFDLYNAGVFTGSDDYGMFQPYAYITRAEVAAIVARCADPSQRKTLTLKPLSQREAPELIGGYNKNAKMSNGRLAYQDPTTKEWGYLDGNGAAVIPAQYDKVEAFESGYAKVQKNGYWGLINTAGAVVLPVEYSEINYLQTPGAYSVTNHKLLSLWYNGRLVTKADYASIYSLGDGLFRVNNSQYSWGLIDSNGRSILPCSFGYDVGTTGDYFYGKHVAESDGYAIYDQNGTLLMDNVSDYAKGNPLLAVKEGEKYAVAVGSKKITEAVYDSVKPAENSSYATVKYGDLTGLVGLNGELIAPGVYDKYGFNGDYFTACQRSEYGQPCEVVIGDATGVIRRHTGNYVSFRSPGIGLEVYEDEGEFLTRISASGYHPIYVLFLKDGTTWEDAYGNREWKSEGGKYYRITTAGKVFGPRDGYSEDFNYYWDDGSYGIWDNETGELSEPIYASSGEAEKAYDEYYCSKPENKKYDIRQSDAGKPIVAYGNGITGWTPVIEYYKNNLYYDEIQELGEGYYACRFNTTWYLLHA